MKNPNRNDPRRFSQVYKPDFMWDPSIPYDQLPKLLDQNGPRALIFPDHFYEDMGGVVIIHWKKNPTTLVICSVVLVQEEKTFTFQLFDTKGKKRKTFFDTGK